MPFLSAPHPSSDSHTADATLVRALRNFNVPKLVQNDVDMFLSLFTDVFPG